MPNDMRDRLIEKLNKSFAEQYEKRGLLTAVHTADHLIANGVILPPCKVGDEIFYIDRYSGKVERDVIKYFTVTKNGIKPILERHNTLFWKMYDWCKTVFLTKEEAEKALAKEKEK